MDMKKCMLICFFISMLMYGKNDIIMRMEIVEKEVVIKKEVR
jgi:hypothetical protein